MPIDLGARTCLAEMRRRTADEQDTAAHELRRYLPQLIAEGETNRENLMVKGLVHLRRCENRLQPLPVWMRRRNVDGNARSDRH